MEASKYGKLNPSDNIAVKSGRTENSPILSCVEDFGEIYRLSRTRQGAVGSHIGEILTLGSFCHIHFVIIKAYNSKIRDKSGRCVVIVRYSELGSEITETKNGATC
ncbi:hypothetical protein GWI33_023099 [Rhynchophorus ferrugineus]|uniref:Uncharacterized protein n=1 Tax=Rhynchophorus ferrugineus TaxID=354439 RepID=A0A834ING4_RHYFE|nr:hypothetical protein GWI33_023099 [Rhynchophorus ferrugineus]